MNVAPATLLRGLLIVTVAMIWMLALGRRGSVALAVLATLAAWGLWVVYRRWVRVTARRVIREQPFPGFLRARVRASYPQLDDAQLADVERGLRQFFIASANAGGRFVAMPSKVVDTLWHEFILHTRGYEAFCRRAFGRLLHHTPAEALPLKPKKGDDRRAGLRRAWYWSCKEEGIDPRKPDRLPVLFALDASLAIAGGYHYVPDCSLLGADRGSTHCAGDVGCGSSCGSSGGSDSGSGSDAGSGGDGSCGSGCGGGGD